MRVKKNMKNNQCNWMVKRQIHFFPYKLPTKAAKEDKLNKTSIIIAY